MDGLWSQFSIPTTLHNGKANPSHVAKSFASTPIKISASAAQIAESRNLVDTAISEAIGRNDYLIQHPRRNKYPPGPDASLSRNTTLPGDQLSYIPSSQLKSAAALIAELDADELDKGGTLFTDYQIAYRISGSGEIGHRVQRTSDISKREAAASSYWLDDLGSKYRGKNPFGKENAQLNYKVYRNVKDYGAKGDGKTDDTKAINDAIQDGNRCGANCGSSTVKGATIYFPPGTYLVSGSIIALYHSQLIGDPHNLPVLLAAPFFPDLGVISADVYYPDGNGKSWYLATGNFFRHARNFIIDISKVRNDGMKALHWQVAQASSLQNIHVKMRKDSTQIGLWIENGSGGIFTDLTFEGGAAGIECGNQQFTSRNLIFENCRSAIRMLWDWGWVWKDLYVSGSEIGINFTTTDFPGGSLFVMDSTFKDTRTGIFLNHNPKRSDRQSTVTLQNIHHINVETVVRSETSRAELKGGGDARVPSWIIGSTYPSEKDKGKFRNGESGSDLRFKPPSGLFVNGKPESGVYSRSRNQYADRTNWVVPEGAIGDGVHDDTAALSLSFAIAARTRRPVFLPTGSYIVTDTIQIPPGLIVSGMCWSQIVASGKGFEDINNPKPMIRVGNKGEVGDVEISDLLFTARGATAGWIGMEWNLKATSAGSAAMWDTAFRIGGALGTGLQKEHCPRLSGTVKKSCIAGSMMLHLTSTSSAYLENIWAWTADHDIDDVPEGTAQIDVYVARGM